MIHSILIFSTTPHSVVETRQASLNPPDMICYRILSRLKQHRSKYLYIHHYIARKSAMPRAPKHPKSLWRSSPLSGLKTPDDLKLTAEVRHRHRNLLARRQKTHGIAQIAENVATIQQIPNDSSNVHSFKQPGQEEDNAREHTETSLYPQQQTKKFGCVLKDIVEQKPSLALAPTTVPEHNSPTSPTTSSLASSPCNPKHTASSLPDHCKTLRDGEDQETDSDNYSEWSHTMSSSSSCAQHLDGDDL